MKKVIKNYLAKLQENEQKGFSLVELIIVMAIMAILVGVVASQVIPYMEKSRLSKDQEALASLQMDVQNAFAMSGKAAANSSGAANGFKFTAGNVQTNLNSETASEIQTLRGTIESFSDMKFKSKKASASGNDLYCIVNESSGEITMLVGTNASTAADAKLKVSSKSN